MSVDVSLVPGSVHELFERRVRLHEVVRRERDAETIAQVFDALALVLATPVCQQDERDIVALQVFQRLCCTRDRLCNVQQDAVNTIRVILVWVVLEALQLLGAQSSYVISSGK